MDITSARRDTINGISPDASDSYRDGPGGSIFDAIAISIGFCQLRAP